MIDRTVRARLSAIAGRAHRESHPVGPWEVRLARHLGPEQYEFETEWEAAAERCLWPAVKTVFLRAQWQRPRAKSDGKMFLRFALDSLEGLLSVDGRPYAGVDRGHDMVPCPDASAALLELEFISQPQAQCVPHLLSEPGTWKGCTAVVVDPEVERFFYDVAFAWDTATTLPEGRVRTRLERAVESSLLDVDPKAPWPAFAEHIRKASALFAGQVDAIGRDPEAGRLLLTGHSHLDTAWLWPLRETVRKCARTFSTACRLMELYPDYRFSCSQPQLYKYVELHYPALFEDIQKQVAAGRWEATGAFWVEADCNVSSGEALIRQALYGIRWFEKHFGKRPRSCWLPDVFGYPASLPTILKGCGVDYFYTNKLHWHTRNEFPSHLFWWRGTDGARVLAHVPNHVYCYNGQVIPAELREDWERFRQKGEHDEILVPFGHGDGGGGATIKMLEYARRAAHFPGLPAASQGLSEAYFERAEAEAGELPSWWGELYFENHRGTYTTQSAMKKANRKAELLYRDTEILGALARGMARDVDLSLLEPGWEALLTHQFHDILPGSSIGQVYREGAENLAGAAAVADGVKASALEALGASPGEAISERFVLFNTLSWPRSDAVTVTAAAPGAAFHVVNEQTGAALAAQVIARDAGTVRFVFCPDEVPGIGFASFTIRPGTAEAETSLNAAGLRITNRFLDITLNETGEIVSLVDRRADRQVVPEGAVMNELQLLQDPDESESAWNVNKESLVRRHAFDGGQAATLVESGPVRAVVRVERRHGETRIRQDIIIYDKLPRIDFVTDVDWHTRETLLKAAFPADVLAREVTCEIQFGVLERPTHRNTSWDEEKFEICAHRWIDLSQADYGISLLNDCRYGHDALGNVVRISLLRGTAWPDPDADRGRHKFTYSLLPHCGGWRTARTVRAGWELNVPLLAVACGAEPVLGRKTGTLLALEAGSSVVEALKPAEDGRGLILRVYESHGGADAVTVRAAFDVARVIPCNHVEEDGAEPLASEDRTFSFEMRPWQVRSFRLLPAGE